MISIIIPVYNVEKYLSKCLDSCFYQSITEIEVLAINDGSADSSGLILDEYALNEPRLKVFHQLNNGVVVARNIGIDNALGEWLMFVDSDDCLSFDSLRILYDLVLINNACISVGAFRIVGESNNIIEEKKPNMNHENDRLSFASDILTDNLNLSLGGKLFHRSLFDNIQTNPKLKIGEDAYITIQLVNNSFKIVQTDKIVYNYLQRNVSVTHSPSKEAINSIIYFINLVVEYYKNQLYYHETTFQHCLNYFIMNQFFTYIRMGGDYSCNNIVKRVNIECLNDNVACSMLPVWRLLLLKSFRINKLLGAFICRVIVFLRLFKNILSK